MSALEELELEDFVREKVQNERWTHAQVSKYLKESNTMPTRGLSERSIRRFCRHKGIHRTSRIDDQLLNERVSRATAMVSRTYSAYANLMRKMLQVGPVYGRKTMTGLLASQGLRVSQARVGEALKRTNPLYHYKRSTSTVKLMNPVPYSADYFGQKLHVDQNENLAMYGVTHVCARDGYSGKVVGFISMPVKNNLDIYANLFRCL